MTDALIYIGLWGGAIGAAVTGILALVGYGSSWKLEIRFVSEEELREQ